MNFWPWFILVTAYGACVGSFLNVVIYRLPEGVSIITPPSKCPRCGHRLAWYDNVPVLGWMWLRGKCRYCATPISFQYPLVEALTAAAFGGLMWAYFRTDMRSDFVAAGLGQAWPVFAVHLALLAALIAATVIDARLYIIPISIPWVIIILAAVVMPLTAALMPESQQVVCPAQPVTAWAAFGGLGGLALAVVLLRVAVLPLSFAEYVEQDRDTVLDADPPAASGADASMQGDVDAQPQPPSVQDEILSYAHARREMLKEGLFVAFPVVGFLVGWWLAPSVDLPVAIRTLGTVALGMLAGGAIVWGTRILGTLGFGKEAMGLGDVHLMAGIGAVIGPADTIVALFIAPFFGMLGVLVAVGVSRLSKGEVRVIPYGPYLAVAAVAMMVVREPVLEYFGILRLIAC